MAGDEREEDKKTEKPANLFFTKMFNYVLVLFLKKKKQIDFNDYL